LASVRTKDILGFQRSGTDRSFYIAQLVRKLRRGELGRNISITAAGKRDGAGAQAQAVISAIAFADAFGLDYVHSPFRYVCHPEGPVAQWTESWEKTFNFGQGHVQVETCGRPVIPLGDFLKDRSLRNKDCVVQLIHYQHWTNYNPSAYVSVAPIATRYADRVTGELWQFISTAATYRQRGPLKRITPNPPIATTLHRVVALLRARGETPSIRIFSQGAPEDFKEFAAFGPEFHLDKPAIWTFHQLVEADVLIMARSAFSFVAGILSEGINLYEPFQERPLPNWIVRDANGRFDDEAFGDQLDRLPVRLRQETAGPGLEIDSAHPNGDRFVAG
jgi:hypothetical protein